MAYSRDLTDAARRHLQAGDALNHPPPAPRREVAGYLYGLAAECALKQLMVEAGIPQPPLGERRSHPYFLHFPELKTALRNLPAGRWHSRLLPFTEPPVMQDWDVQMRYAPAREITDKMVERWSQDARQLVQKMGLP